MDAIHSNDDSYLHNLGLRMILRATHYDSPRWYQESFQDAMAIVRHYCRPHLFVTFTAHAKWPEITESLFPGQETTDRPDIVNRVFNMKVKELLEDIMKKDILGKVNAMVGMVEFQKRGLPHIHLMHRNTTVTTASTFLQRFLINNTILCFMTLLQSL